jgi:hypothetical protein
VIGQCPGDSDFARLGSEEGDDGRDVPHGGWPTPGLPVEDGERADAETMRERLLGETEIEPALANVLARGRGT